MEYLDIVDENGEPTGAVIERTEAHAKGIHHRTSHVWLLRERRNEKGDRYVQVLLQKRSACKDSFPGCYDISSAGHIPAGNGWEESAVRELHEELGYDITEKELHFLGDIRKTDSAEFNGRPYYDDQTSRVFYIVCDRDEKDFVLQTEEVEEVRWMNLSECKEAVRKNMIVHCIYIDELEMLPEKLT